MHLPPAHSCIAHFDVPPCLPHICAGRKLLDGSTAIADATAKAANGGSATAVSNAAAKDNSLAVAKSNADAVGAYQHA
jgi:hypothetical protein